MKMTIEELAPLADVHLVGMVDVAQQLERQFSLSSFCKSVDMHVRVAKTLRNLASLLPHAVREFRDADFAWILHRVGFQAKSGRYRARIRAIGAIPRGLPVHSHVSLRTRHTFPIGCSLAKNAKSPFRRAHYFYEYLRCFRYELKVLPKFRRIQTCSQENAGELTDYLPAFANKIDVDLRAGIQCAKFNCVLDGREPDTLLFVGSFRHDPNVEAIRWFVGEILPRITAVRPQAQLVIVGSDPPPSLSFLLDTRTFGSLAT